MQTSLTPSPCVVRLNALGDVVLTTGVLLHWHRSMGTRFTMITKQEFLPVFAGHPGVEDLIGLKGDQIKNWLHTVRHLRKEHENAMLIDLHGTARTLLLKLLWSGPTCSYSKMSLERRIFRITRSPMLGKRLLRTNVPQRYAMALEPHHPPVEKLLPRIFLSQQELDHARDILSGLKLDPGIVVLHPYATHPAKKWPDDSWRGLLSILDKNKLQWLVVGRSPAPLLPNDPRDLTNRTSLRETCSLIASGSCMITNDSGPMHLATAVNTPVLGLFGPTSREWGFYPCGPADRVLFLGLDCSPCTLHGRIRCSRNFACMQTITPARVMEELSMILAERNS
ncbi:MAG: glycosyltransferase family 9 protein [Desulfovibrionales bacterium]